jgi:hypothetical protein
MLVTNMNDIRYHRSIHECVAVRWMQRPKDGRMRDALAFRQWLPDPLAGVARRPARARADLSAAEELDLDRLCLERLELAYHR